MMENARQCRNGRGKLSIDSHSRRLLRRGTTCSSPVHLVKSCHRIYMVFRMNRISSVISNVRRDTLRDNLHSYPGPRCANAHSKDELHTKVRDPDRHQAPAPCASQRNRLDKTLRVVGCISPTKTFSPQPLSIVDQSRPTITARDPSTHKHAMHKPSRHCRLAPSKYRWW